MGRARGANALMNLAFETTYGAPPASGYSQLPFVTSNLGAEQGLIESDLLGLGRAPADPTYDVVTNNGDVVVPVDALAIGHWLKLLLGLPTTGGSGTLTHTFDSGAVSLPSASIEIGHPDRPSYSTNYGVMANTMQIAVQRGGLLNATFGLMAKGETAFATSSTAGTPEIIAPSALTRFAQASGAILIDGVAQGEILTAQLNYSNGLDPDATIRADSEINGIDPGMPTASISMTAKFADTVLLNKATSQTPVAVQLQWASAARTLTVTLGRVFLPRRKRPISGPAGIQIDLDGMASTPAGGPLLRAVLVNNKASYA
jgi:hypothetical protein